jgi:hypothetical protein
LNGGNHFVTIQKQEGEEGDKGGDVDFVLKIQVDEIGDSYEDDQEEDDIHQNIMIIHVFVKCIGRLDGFFDVFVVFFEFGF